RRPAVFAIPGLPHLAVFSVGIDGSVIHNSLLKQVVTGHGSLGDHDSSVIPSSEGAQWRQVWHLRRPPSHAPEGSRISVLRKTPRTGTPCIERPSTPITLLGQEPYFDDKPERGHAPTSNTRHDDNAPGPRPSLRAEGHATGSHCRVREGLQSGRRRLDVCCVSRPRIGTRRETR